MQGDVSSAVGIALAGNRSFPCQLKQAAPRTESMWPPRNERFPEPSHVIRNPQPRGSGQMAPMSGEPGDYPTLREALPWLYEPLGQR
jgi:hypothetical protein